MPPSTYRLDTLAATLIGRLEAVRRAHVGDPVACGAALAEATRDGVARVAAECRETTGDEAQARLLEKEGVGTFLPRYTSLALAQNRDEGRIGLGGLVGQVVGRFVGVFVGLLVSLVFVRFVHGAWDLLYFVLPTLFLFWPDLLGALWRRRFTRQLQEVVDDLSTLQEAHDKLPPEATPSKAPEPTRPRTREAN